MKSSLVFYFLRTNPLVEGKNFVIALVWISLLASDYFKTQLFSLFILFIHYYLNKSIPYQ